MRTLCSTFQYSSSNFFFPLTFHFAIFQRSPSNRYIGGEIFRTIETGCFLFAISENHRIREIERISVQLKFARTIRQVGMRRKEKKRKTVERLFRGAFRVLHRRVSTLVLFPPRNPPRSKQRDRRKPNAKRYCSSVRRFEEGRNARTGRQRKLRPTVCI